MVVFEDMGSQVWSNAAIHFFSSVLSYFIHLCMLVWQDPSYYVLKEDESPCIFGPIDKQRWSYACAKQLIERLVYGRYYFSQVLPSGGHFPGIVFLLSSILLFYLCVYSGGCWKWPRVHNCETFQLDWPQDGFHSRDWWSKWRCSKGFSLLQQRMSVKFVLLRFCVVFFLFFHLLMAYLGLSFRTFCVANHLSLWMVVNPRELSFISRTLLRPYSWWLYVDYTPSITYPLSLNFGNHQFTEL